MYFVRNELCQETPMWRIQSLFAGVTFARCQVLVYVDFIEKCEKGLTHTL